MIRKSVKIDIAGTEYGESWITSLKTHRAMIEGEPTVGNCISGELTATLIVPNDQIPKNAKITPYIQTRDESAVVILKQDWAGTTTSGVIGKNYANLGQYGTWSFDLPDENLMSSFCYYFLRLINGTAVGGRFFYAESAPVDGSATNIQIWIDVPLSAGAAGKELFPGIGVTDVYNTIGINDTPWRKKSEFFVFSRRLERDTGAVEIVAYDAIYKAEAAFAQPGNIGQWPRVDLDVMREIARRTGTTICAETVAAMNKAYKVQFPGITIEGTDANTYKTDGSTTMREVAGRIAAMYAGNWIIDNNGEWRLLILGDIPPETNLLVDENGDYIKLGDDRILIVTGLTEPNNLITEDGNKLLIGGVRLLV